MTVDDSFLEELFAQKEPLRRVRDAMACLRVVEAYLLNQTPEMTPKQAQGLVQQAGRQLVTVNKVFEEIPRETLVLPQPTPQAAPTWFIGRLVESPGKPPRMEYYDGPVAPPEVADAHGWGSRLEGATQFQDKASAEEVRLWAASGHPHPSFVRSYAEALAINESTSVLPPPVAPVRPASSRPNLAPIRTELPPPPPETPPPTALSAEEAAQLVRQLRKVDQIVGPWLPTDDTEQVWECQEFLGKKVFARVERIREDVPEGSEQWRAVVGHQVVSLRFPTRQRAMECCMGGSWQNSRVVYLSEMP